MGQIKIENITSSVECKLKDVKPSHFLVKDLDFSHPAIYLKTSGVDPNGYMILVNMNTGDLCYSLDREVKEVNF